MSVALQGRDTVQHKQRVLHGCSYRQELMVLQNTIVFPLEAPGADNTSIKVPAEGGERADTILRTISHGSIPGLEVNPGFTLMNSCLRRFGRL